MNILDRSLIGIGIAVLLGATGVSWFGYTHPSVQLAGSFNPTGAGTYLTQNSISASQSTITISASTPFNEPASNIPYTMNYIGTNIVYGTLSPASGQPGIDNSEFVAFTGITQNSNGTATLTGVTRGLARTPGTGGCVASSTLAHAYPSQTKFILSNSPCFYSQYAVKQNNETILGGWTYPSTTPPRLDEDPTSAQWALFSSSTLVTYHQLQITSFAGVTNASITAKGIVQIASSTQAASSTNVGSSGAFDVLGAGYATDTPQNCTGLRSGGCVVMSLLNAKIAQAWLDLTQAFTFSGGLTSTGATNIAATASNKLTANSVAYVFPPALAASSSMLETNASGLLFWVVPPTTPRYTSTGTGLSNIGGSGAAAGTSTASIVIPANVITGSSTIEVWGTNTCSATGGGTSDCTVTVRTSAGTPLAAFTVTAQASEALTNNWHVLIMSNNSTSAQNYLVTGGKGSSSAYRGQITANGSSAVALGSGQTLVVTLAVGANSANNSNLDSIAYVVNP